MQLAHWLGDLRWRLAGVRHFSRKRRRSRRRPLESSIAAATEVLEERLLLSGMSPLDESVPVGTGPIDVATGLVNQDGYPDVVTLGADGRITVAINAGDGHFDAVNTFDVGLGPAVGMASGLVDSNSRLDLAVQTPDGIFLLTSDAAGGYTVAQTFTPAATGELAANSGAVRPLITLLNGDFAADLATVVPGTDEVLVFFGQGDGTFADPVHYASGADQPVAVAAADLIGDAFPDLAIGHADGTLTFLEGHGDGTFILRPELSVTGLGAIADIQADDFDGNGKADLVVSSGDHVTLLTADPDAQPASVLANGDFSRGLTGWETEAVGQTDDASAGAVNALGGVAQLTENESFLVTLSQSFNVPEAAQTVTFDLLSLGLESEIGGVPDAFEVSLLDAAGNPLVETFRPEATSFFNAAPDGTILWANGVTFDGRTVTLDISGLTAGTEATLYFDLVGNPPGRSSSVMLDNVRVTPEVVSTETFTATLLDGPFVDAAGLAVDDLDGDGTADILVADAGADRLAVFSGDGASGFTRSEVDLSGFGSLPVAVATGRLTPGDPVADAAVILQGSSVLVSPLGLNAVPVITSPETLAGTEGETVSLNGTFTAPDVAEPFTATVDWGDGTTTSATVTFSAGVGTVNAEHVYADDGTYAVRLTVTNALGQSGEANLSADISNSPPVMTTAADQAAIRTETINVSASFTDLGFGPTETFTAQVDWGDGTVESAEIALTPGAAGQPTTGIIGAVACL